MQAALATDGKNLDAVLGQVGSARSAAVLLATAGSATVPLVRGLKKTLPGVLMAGVSASLTSESYKQLGDAGSGLAVTMVMPDPNKGKTAVVRDYQAAMKARGQNDFNLGSLEGYVNMRVLAEGLERAGNDPTRAKLRGHPQLGHGWLCRGLQRPGAVCGFALHRPWRAGGLGALPGLRATLARGGGFARKPLHTIRDPSCAVRVGPDPGRRTCAGK